MPLAFLPPIPPQPKRAEDLVLYTEEVTSGDERRQFASVARYVHRGDRRWVPPLPCARQAALRPNNPLLPGKVAGFTGIARNLGLGDEAVGAIAAYSAVAGEDEGATGCWGLFDAIYVTALVERLFYAAETWLFENTPGITALQGPTSMEPLTPAGLLIDGFDAWPTALLPYNPPYYSELVEGEGYEQARTWSAWTLASAAGGGKRSSGEPVDWRAISATFARSDYAEDNAPGLKAWLAHLADAQPFLAHRHTRWTLARAFSRAIHATSGNGLCLAIPDLAPALRLTRGRLVPFGYLSFSLALTRSRRLRVFPALAPDDWRAQELTALYGEMAAKAGECGYRELVIAPISDENEKSAAALTALGARITQRFAIYEKTL